MTDTTSTTPALALTAHEQDLALAVARLADEQERRGSTLTLALDWKRQHVAACEQRDALARDLDTVRRLLAEERRAHEQFRTQVRDKAIEIQEQQDWCVEGLNEVLESLGLDPKEQEYEVEVEVTARQVVVVKVTATDEDAAKDKVTDGDVDLEPDRYGWEWQTTDDLEFLSVEPA